MARAKPFPKVGGRWSHLSVSMSVRLRLVLRMRCILFVAECTAGSISVGPSTPIARPGAWSQTHFTPMNAMPEMAELPNLALIGSGLFVRGQYVPRLREAANLLSLKAIWSRSEQAAKAIVELVKDFAPTAEAKWGPEGLNDILEDRSIHGVVVVVAAPAQVEITLQALKAGKHVLQEKPASTSVSEALEALSLYNSLHSNNASAPIWAVAENYRFETGLIEAARIVKEEIGEMMIVEVVAEAPMNSANPYFSTAWRQAFPGGFTLDMGVHFVAGLRMVVGTEISSVAALAQHKDKSLPAPDNISALLKFKNDCTGVFAISISATSRKISWRVVGSKGTVEVARGSKENQHGYMVTFYPSKGMPQSSFYPFCGVQLELEIFAKDMSKAISQTLTAKEADARSSPAEGACDVAVIEALLKSSSLNGAWVNVDPILS